MHKEHVLVQLDLVQVLELLIYRVDVALLQLQLITVRLQQALAVGHLVVSRYGTRLKLSKTRAMLIEVLHHLVGEFLKFV